MKAFLVLFVISSLLFSQTRVIGINTVSQSTYFSDLLDLRTTRNSPTQLQITPNTADGTTLTCGGGDSSTTLQLPITLDLAAGSGSSVVIPYFSCFDAHLKIFTDGDISKFTCTSPDVACDIVASVTFLSLGVAQWGITGDAFDAIGQSILSYQSLPPITGQAAIFLGVGDIPAVSGCGSIGANSTNPAGFITSATTGSCVSVLTFSETAFNGWSCGISNSTTANLIRQTGSGTTTATFTGVTVSGDVLRYVCIAY